MSRVEYVVCDICDEREREDPKKDYKYYKLHFDNTQYEDICEECRDKIQLVIETIYDEQKKEKENENSIPEKIQKALPES